LKLCANSTGSRFLSPFSTPAASAGPGRKGPGPDAHVAERRGLAAVRPKARSRQGGGVIRGSGRLGRGDLAGPITVGKGPPEAVARSAISTVRDGRPRRFCIPCEGAVRISAGAWIRRRSPLQRPSAGHAADDRIRPASVRAARSDWRYCSRSDAARRTLRRTFGFLPKSERRRSSRLVACLGRQHAPPSGAGHLGLPDFIEGGHPAGTALVLSPAFRVHRRGSRFADRLRWHCRAGR